MGSLPMEAAMLKRVGKKVKEKATAAGRRAGPFPSGIRD